MNRTAATAATGRLVLDGAGIAQKVRQMAQGIVKEFGPALEGLCVVGIQTRGVVLARRLAAQLSEICGRQIPLGILDITLYRDDVHAIAEQPEVKETDLPVSIDDVPVILVDDVLFTGRTVRSAMNALIDYGRPQCIRLAVLIDRGHRELPIGADYTGLTLKTKVDDVVDVNLKEIDAEEGVRLRRKT
ncbi:MAG TPA: bifunctional pyr operon transcriptional regulator/uracil phosphoribosyltransferase PyrR [Elusimicrobiota bacterium]|nr:bifunctional pyr operon transcriptional regulator/uracil phosphoribosyltransferase PyrR [Elusimicrobiota bacterium]